MHDFRFALRLLLRNPLPSLVIVASLALGIGGAASVFTVLNALVLRTLPVVRSDQLVLAEKQTRNGTSPRFSWPAVVDAGSEIGTRAEIAGLSDMTAMQVRAAGDPAGHRALVQLVSGEYFPLLRERAQLGRLLTEGDNRESAPGVGVISNRYWHRQFNASPAVVGQTITVNGASITIVGITRPEFQGTSPGFRGTDIWVPLMLQPLVKYAANVSSHGAADTTRPWPPQRQVEWLRLLVRVPDDSVRDGIASAIHVVLARDARLERESPAGASEAPPEATAVLLRPAARGLSRARDQLSTPLYLLLGMTGLLLTIASANVASLLLARALNREQEMAIRLSIGAGRGRLVRQVLVESILLSGIATVLGLLVAAWGREFLLRLFAPPGTTVLELDMGFDARVLAFTALVGVVTGIMCGLVPAFRGTRARIADALKLQGRGASGLSGARALLGRSFVAGQIALCAVLVVLSGLLGATLRELTRADVGFDRDRLLVARVDVRSLGLPPDARDALARRVLECVGAMPGITSASVSLNGPLANSAWASSMRVEGHTPAPDEQLITNEEVVTNAYFTTVGLKLLAGRAFEPADERREGRTTIINESMARRFFRSPRGAIGKRWSYDDSLDSNAFTIVGVVEDAKYLELREQTPNMAYHPMVAMPDQVISSVEMRTAGEPAAMVTSVQRALRESVPELPVVDLVPFAERISRAASAERLVAQLTTVFSGIALILAAVGLYGTLSYAVSRRTGELGLRMALGADRATVLRLVMREAVTLVAIGAVIGLPMAFAAGRALGGLLFGVAPLDPTIYASGALILGGVALTAAYLPARRAASIDPMTAVREG